MTYSDNSFVKEEQSPDARTRVLPLRRSDLLSGTFLMVVFLFIATFTAIDVYEDALSGSSLRHVTWEALVIAFSTFALVYLFSRTARFYKNNFELQKLQNKNLTQEVDQWKESCEKFTKGLTENIDKQFAKWNLSPAEKDVALLAIKGLSTKEIAELRKTCEKTVRLQCSSVYSKANVHSKGQLISYFIEDIFAATPESKNSHSLLP